MTRVDALFAAIAARAAAAAGETPRPTGAAPVPGGRSGRDRLDLDTSTGVECEICPTGWASVRLFTRGHATGRLACARCAEKARMRAATMPHLGPAVWRPIDDGDDR